MGRDATCRLSPDAEPGDARRDGRHPVGDHGGVEITCARCGAPFGCGVDRPTSDPCWCADVAISDAARARLATTYTGCLCGRCLEAVADGGTTVPDPGHRRRDPG
jgi:hypothetical protein